MISMNVPHCRVQITPCVPIFLVDLTAIADTDLLGQCAKQTLINVSYPHVRMVGLVGKKEMIINAYVQQVSWQFCLSFFYSYSFSKYWSRTFSVSLQTSFNSCRGNLFTNMSAYLHVGVPQHQRVRFLRVPKKIISRNTKLRNSLQNYLCLILKHINSSWYFYDGRF